MRRMLMLFTAIGALALSAPALAAPAGVVVQPTVGPGSDASSLTVTANGCAQSLVTWVTIPCGPIHVPATTTDFTALPIYRVDRFDLTGSGTAGSVYNAIWGLTDSNAWNAGFEWSILGSVENSALNVTGAQNVGVSGAIEKTLVNDPTYATTGASGTGATATVAYSGGKTFGLGDHVTVAGMSPSAYNGTFTVTAASAGSVSYASTATGAQTAAGTVQDISVGPSWGVGSQCVDSTNEASPLGSCIGAEFDVIVNSTTALLDPFGERILLQLAAHTSTSASAPGTHVGTGIFEAGDADTTIDYAYKFGGAFGQGIDFTGGTFSGADILMSNCDKIALGASPGGDFVRWLNYCDGALFYHAGSINALTITDAGQLTVDSGVISGSFVRPGTTIFANIPTIDATPQVGDMMNITDASACTANNAVTGGGGSAHSCPTVYNGSGWIAMVTH